MSVQIAKRFFSVGEYYRMAEAGILSEDDRVELIEGEIIEMSPIGSTHAACVKRLNALLVRHFGSNAIISVQDPVQLNDYSEPEPDVAALKPKENYYADRHPTPDDVLLIVEVADTSVEYDRSLKLPLYARAGILEVWLVNLPADVIEVYARPAGSSYQNAQQFARGETLTSQTIFGLSLDVDDILGQA